MKIQIGILVLFVCCHLVKSNCMPGETALDNDQYAYDEENTDNSAIETTTIEDDGDYNEALTEAENKTLKEDKKACLIGCNLTTTKKPYIELCNAEQDQVMNSVNHQPYQLLLTAAIVHLVINFASLNRIYLDGKSEKHKSENKLLVHRKDIYPVVTNYEMMDWHDYEFMNYEASRRGPGENGTAVFLTDPSEIELDNELYKIEGLSVVVSDKISVNRSVPDVRNLLCQTKLYLKYLPHVSVIVIFHNEHWSLIMRTLHGIYNRSPHELLDEIILVNDASTRDILYKPLEKYVNDNFHGKVKVVKLSTRKGLIVARMEGAKAASTNKFIYPTVINYEMKDWHDYNFMDYEAKRIGPGEQGAPVYLEDEEDKRLDAQTYAIEGLSVVTSDKISVNRSIPDVRNERCKTKKYLKHLPHVSVIVIFHNEHLSILLRSIHGIFNRSPHELLEEIIMVNDASTKDELYEPLQTYVSEHFNGKAKIVNLKERKGLIVARMEGAKVATSEVVVFLDSHMEVNANWLPPLLEPIALNPRVSTTPLIDEFDFLTFKYFTFNNNGWRGMIGWDFDFKWNNLRPEDDAKPSEPHEIPIMLGCAFAINRQYFWDLGAYDDELQIWNGENYELSFKLWLCGGELLEVPCSRVAHVFRRHNTYRKLDGVDFVARNFKRVAEVWMDDYKNLLYSTDPERFAKVDVGDLTKQKAIRTDLNCKSFDYFITVICPDLLLQSPIPHDEDVAYGAVRSHVGDNLCLDSGVRSDGTCELYACHRPPNLPKYTQFVRTTLNRTIFHDSTRFCFDSHEYEKSIPDYKYGDGRWEYDL
ncbi:unnamed protein product, partial [Diamesa tonsa]